MVTTLQDHVRNWYCNTFGHGRQMTRQVDRYWRCIKCGERIDKCTYLLGAVVELSSDYVMDYGVLDGEYRLVHRPLTRDCYIYCKWWLVWTFKVWFYWKSCVRDSYVVRIGDEYL